MKPSGKNQPGNYSEEGVISSRRRTCLPYTEGRPDLSMYLARFSQPLSSSSETAGGGGDRKASGQDVGPGARGAVGVAAAVGGKERSSGRMEGLVFACGPSALMEAAREAAGDASMDFRREMFQI